MRLGDNVPVASAVMRVTLGRGSVLVILVRRRHARQDGVNPLNRRLCSRDIRRTVEVRDLEWCSRIVRLKSCGATSRHTQAFHEFIARFAAADDRRRCLDDDDDVAVLLRRGCTAWTGGSSGLASQASAERGAGGGSLKYASPSSPKRSSSLT